MNKVVLASCGNVGKDVGVTAYGIGICLVKITNVILENETLYYLYLVGIIQLERLV